jgi:hypothetical protein
MKLRRSRNTLSYTVATLVVVTALPACSTNAPGPATEHAQRDKITLDLSTLDDRGLRGSPSGLRSMSYEFCIPANERYAAEVQRIDPTLELMRGSRGRIGCTKSQYLCVGQTSQRGYRQVLERLAELDYTSRIVESTFE